MPGEESCEYDSVPSWVKFGEDSSDPVTGGGDFSVLIFGGILLF